MSEFSNDRRNFLALTAAAAAAGLIPGLAPNAWAQAAKLSGSLDFAAADWLQPNRGPAMWNVISQFGALNPDLQFSKIEYPNEAYQNAMRTELGAGQGPDVLALNIAVRPVRRSRSPHRSYRRGR